jgi:hypothetical protein
MPYGLWSHSEMVNYSPLSFLLFNGPIVMDISQLII